MFKTYRDLKFWQNAYQVFLSIVNFSKKLPRDSVNDILLRQIIKSSSSVGANIAEGYGRFKSKEYSRFLQISLGSANETDYWLRLLCGVYPRLSEEISNIISKNEESIKMLTASLSSIKKRKS